MTYWLQPEKQMDRAGFLMPLSAFGNTLQVLLRSCAGLADYFPITAASIICSCAAGCASFISDSRSASIPTPPPMSVETKRTSTPVPLPQGIGAPFEPASVIPTASSERSIDLAAALELAGAENATIARAVEAVRASLALELEARAQLLPSLNAGANLNEHWGSLESSSGIILDVQRQALYVGSGAGTVGAGTVGVPGIRLTSHLTEALFEPAAARDEVTARRFEAASVRNRILLDVVRAYFELIGAEAQLAALHQSQGELAELVRITASFAKTGAGRASDADRASSEAELLQIEEERVQEQIAVAAAQLARLLHLDPSVRLRGPGGPLPLIDLVDPDIDLARLLTVAVASNPELIWRSAEIAAAEKRWREERFRPYLPFVGIGFSAGQFGGGGNLVDVRFGHFDGRADFDALAVWKLDNLGFGNRALQRQRREVVDERIAERLDATDRVRQETVEAVADAAASRSAIDVARREMENAAASYGEDLLRIRNKEGRPIEVLISATQLAVARRNFIVAVIEHDVAQFRLHVALGQPPSAT
jgi:outer membrane protein TolC